jgi:lysophospholipase L1-like esterase
MKTKKKSRLIRILVTLTLTLILAVMAELYLRETATYITRSTLQKTNGLVEQDPEFLVESTARGRRLVPNASVVINNHFLSKRDIPVQTNSLGFRDDDVAKDKGSDEFRVLVLGDSITIGDYLPKHEVYVEYAEQLLKESYPTKKISLINSGVGNTGTEEQLLLLEDTGAQVKPDLVLVALYLNDSRPPWGFSGEIGNRGWIRRHSILIEALYQQIKLFGWVREKGALQFEWIPAKGTLDWKKSSSDFSKLVDLAQYDWGAAWKDDGWSKTSTVLKQIQAKSSLLGAKTALAIFPVSFQVEADFLDDMPQQKARALATELGLPFLDLLPTFREHRGAELFFDQCHPTTRGNQIAGEAFATFVSDLVPVQNPRPELGPKAAPPA